MKTIRIVISITMIAFVAVGWLSFVSSYVKSSSSRAIYVEEGDAYYAEGLYQKAIESYEKAQTEKYKIETEESLIKALKAAYYDGTGTSSDYISEYLELCRQKPSNIEYWSELLSFCLQESNYSSGYSVYSEMKKLNVNDDSLYELTDQINYFFSEKNKIYNVLSGGTTGYYSAYDGKHWRVITPDNSTMYDNVGLYIGGISSDNDYIIVYENDARLIDEDGVVQAILNEYTDNMRAYGDGMIPMQQKNGLWNYYNIKEKKYTLTGYEDASSFQNGVAAVKDSSGWHLIGLDGDVKSDTIFSDVKLYDNGEFIYDRLFVAAVNGAYNIYNDDGTPETSIDAKDMDRYYGGGIAYSDNNNKWGYINMDEKVIIEPQYNGATSFSNGVAGVCNDEKWAFINEEGRIVSDYRFLYIGYNSSENYCPVGDMYNEYYMISFNFR